MVPYEIDLSPKATEVLMAMVALAQKDKVMTLECTQRSTLAGVGTFEIATGASRQEISDVQEAVLLALRVLGLIHTEEEQDITLVFFTQDAYRWVGYHRRGPVRRWWWRTFDNTQHGTLAIFSSITTILAVLEILRLLGLL